MHVVYSGYYAYLSEGLLIGVKNSFVVRNLQKSSYTFF